MKWMSACSKPWDNSGPQVHNRQQARPLDWAAKQVAQESQPEGVPDKVQAQEDVWDGGRVQERQLAGPLCWRLWRTSHLSNSRIRQMGHHRLVRVQSVYR